MSTHYGIYCHSCQVGSDPDLRSGDETLLKLIPLANVLYCLAQKDTEHLLKVELEYHGSEQPEFVAAHAGHDLRIWDEYGYHYTKEGKRIEEPS